MNVLVIVSLWCFKGWWWMLFCRRLPDCNQLFYRKKYQQVMDRERRVVVGLLGDPKIQNLVKNWQ